MVSIGVIGKMVFGVAAMWGVGKGFDYMFAWGMKKPQINKKRLVSEEEE